ncbi:MAG: hypothetical protein V4562_08555 [Pseudomonadota bacterium]
MPRRHSRKANHPTPPTTAPLPHERDESLGMTDGIPSKPVQQAFRDVSRGLQDTDRGPEAARAYRKQQS